MASAEASALTSCEARRASDDLQGRNPASASLSEVHRERPARRLWRFLADCAWALLHDDLSDRIDQIPEYRKARAQALQYAMLRNINR